MYFQSLSLIWNRVNADRSNPQKQKLFGVLGNCFQKCKVILNPKILRIMAIYHRGVLIIPIMGLFDVKSFMQIPRLVLYTVIIH